MACFDQFLGSKSRFLSAEHLLSSPLLSEICRCLLTHLSWRPYGVGTVCSFPSGEHGSMGIQGHTWKSWLRSSLRTQGMAWELLSLPMMAIKSPVCISPTDKMLGGGVWFPNPLECGTVQGLGLSLRLSFVVLFPGPSLSLLFLLVLIFVVLGKGYTQSYHPILHVVSSSVSQTLVNSHVVSALYKEVWWKKRNSDAKEIFRSTKPSFLLLPWVPWSHLTRFFLWQGTVMITYKQTRASVLQRSFIKHQKH